MKATFELFVFTDHLGLPVLSLKVSSDGRQITMPYKGEIKLEDVFKAFREDSKPMEPEKDERLIPSTPVVAVGTIAKNKVAPSGIKKRDVVVCVKSLPREDNVTFEVGKEYTVTEVIRNQSGVIGYGLVDSDSNKVVCMAEEVEFVRENPPVPSFDRTAFKEERFLCECGEENALRKNKGENSYSGNCTKCGKLNVKDLK